MKHKKNIYLTNEQLAKALDESQQQGNPTVDVCKCFRLIAEHLLGDSRYRNYPKALQEDMASAALLKCIRNIKNYKPEKADACFNYYTRCTEHAFWEVLGKHYKQMNAQREMAKMYADMLEQVNSEDANRIRNSLLAEDTTNMISEVRK